jgi:serine/threonine protein kinase
LELLKELSDDPAVALEEVLADHADKAPEGSQSLEDWLFHAVIALVTEFYVSPDVIAKIESLYKHVTNSTSPTAASWAELEGPLGLFLALVTAQAATFAGDQRGRRSAEGKAEALLKIPAVQKCFGYFYGFDEDFKADEEVFLLEEPELYRVGTTSLILRGRLKRRELEPPIDVAVKCLLPRYHGMGTIRAATKRYEKEGGVPGAPGLYRVTDRFLAMDFVDGNTLEECLEKRFSQSNGKSLDKGDIDFIRNLGLAICQSLGKLAALGHHHLDLSPSNIIVVDQTEPMKIQLIDFGHNFLITERVGSSAAFRRAELYVAPELFENPALDDWRADAYSLGVILLCAAAKRQLTKENIGHELDRLWQGDLQWEGAPTLARVVEELIDSDPDQRLILMPRSEDTNPYQHLSDLISEETEVMSTYAERSGSSGFGLLRGFGLVKFYSNAQVMNLLTTGKKNKEPVDDSYKDFPALGWWAGVSIFCWSVVLISFIFLTFYDLDPKVTPTIVSQLTEWTDARFEIGAFWANLPGRVVALTFGITAVTYYVNDFSMLSPKRVGRRIGNLSEAVMRGTAIFLAFPTLWAIVHEPTAWPVCAAIGTSLVVVNNFLALCVAKRAFEVGTRFSTRNAAGDRFINEIFKEWWRLMGAYSLGLLVIGVLLIDGVAHDEGVYAVLVVVINIAKMYRLNCIELAPRVRGCLSRDILTLRRADRQPRPLAERVGSYRWPFAGRIYNWWWTPAGGVPRSPTGIQEWKDASRGASAEESA